LKIAFLANSFHLLTTKSSDFFINFLRESFGDVTVIPSKEAWAELPGKHWDLLIVWQRRYPPEELEAFGADRVVLIPMYDDCPHDEAFWSIYKKFKIMCFSSTLERLLLSYGLQAWGARYYPPVPQKTAAFRPGEGLRGFFWPRVPAVNWNLVKTLIGNADFAHVQLHWTPDIHADLQQPLTPEERALRRVSLSSWTADKREYLDLVSGSNVFFASRVLEGIGMSFLEAMAMGLCVVAPNAPTMNEYMEDGVTGLLYDLQRPVPLDFSHAAAIGSAARESCRVGRERWLKELPDMKAFLQTPAQGYRPRPHLAIAIKGRGIAAARRVYRALKKGLG
jgi:glycosyltransferase involved in cell wall biosynthesis